MEASIGALIDHLLHFGELMGGLILLWKLGRVINRFESVLKDYPPHKHINGSIVYPHDFRPGEVGHMAHAAGKNS